MNKNIFMLIMLIGLNGQNELEPESLQTQDNVIKQAWYKDRKILTRTGVAIITLGLTVYTVQKILQQITINKAKQMCELDLNHTNLLVFFNAEKDSNFNDIFALVSINNKDQPCCASKEDYNKAMKALNSFSEKVLAEKYRTNKFLTVKETATDGSPSTLYEIRTGIYTFIVVTKIKEFLETKGSGNGYYIDCSDNDHGIKDVISLNKNDEGAIVHTLAERWVNQKTESENQLYASIAFIFNKNLFYRCFGCFESINSLIDFNGYKDKYNDEKFKEIKFKIRQAFVDIDVDNNTQSNQN